MLFLGLAELDSINDVLAALAGMSEADLKYIVVERLYIWHATQLGGRLSRGS
jgi:hypothetical protein